MSSEIVWSNEEYQEDFREQVVYDMIVDGMQGEGVDVDELNRMMEEGWDERDENFGDLDDIHFSLRVSRLSQEEISPDCYIAVDLDGTTSVSLDQERGDVEYVILRTDQLEGSALGIREVEPVAYVLQEEEGGIYLD
jgi:hypothetical protein